MGFVKLIKSVLKLRHEHIDENGCVKQAREIISEQRKVRERIDRAAATLNGEDGWFLSLGKRSQ